MKTITIGNEFLSYLEPAMHRFKYLYPDIGIEHCKNKVYIDNDENFLNYKKELFYLLYREKIYKETLEIRTLIYKKMSDG